MDLPKHVLGVILLVVYINTLCERTYASSEAAKYNAALGRPTWQSSWQYEGISLPADKPDYGKSLKAVDGNTDRDSCTHTAAGTPRGSGIWWSVDLGTIQRVQSVKLYNRIYKNNLYERLQKFRIYSTISGHTPRNANVTQLCVYQIAPLGNGEARDFTCEDKVLARYIIVEKERLPYNGHDYNILTLCEVEVYVCRDQNCAHCTEDGCLVCDSGYDSQNGVCTDCPDGKYGEGCSHECSGHCNDTAACHKVTGNCLECEPGYRDLNCSKRCSRGTYGQDCSETCSENCKNSGVCDHIDGHCDCGEGYKGDTCKDQCLVEAYEYGVNCKSRCSAHCGGNGSCSVYDGVCDAKICQPGYVGIYCSKVIGGQKIVIPVACTCAVVLAIIATGFVVLLILRRRRMKSTKPEQQENRTDRGDLDDMNLTGIEGDGNTAGPVHDSQAYAEISEFDLQNTIPQNVEGVYQGIPKAEERDLYVNSDVSVYQPLKTAALKKHCFKKAASKKAVPRKPQFELLDTIPQNEEGVYQGIPKAEERNLYVNSDVTVYQPLKTAASKKASLKKTASKTVQPRKPFRSQ